MRKILAICLLFICFATVSEAQNIGFIGRRVIVNAELSLSPSFTLPNIISNDGKYWHFNYSLSPGFEFIAGKKITVGPYFNFFTTAFESSDYMNGNYGLSYYDLTALGAGAYFKIYFGKNAVAPLGRYFRFQFDWFSYNYKRQGVDNISPSEREHIFGVKIEYGRDFILCQRLKLNYGFFFGATTAGYNFFDYDMIIQETAKTRILAHYAVGLKFGIGFVAF